MRQPSLRFAPVTLGVALAFFLVPMTPDSAAACSPPNPEGGLDAVGTSRAAGPFFFYLGCGESRCAEVLVPQLVRVNEPGSPGTLVAGTFTRIQEPGSDFALLRYVPESALEPATTYEAQLVDADGLGRLGARFQIAAPVDGSPLDALTPERLWGTVTSGAIYRCVAEEWDRDSCETRNDQTWSDSLLSVETLALDLLHQDGWLYGVGAPTPSARLQPWQWERIPLAPGVESCSTLFARNLFTNEEVQRTVCVTGAEPPEGRAPRPATVPPLEVCAEAPTADGVIAEAFLDPWCEARADFCLEPITGSPWGDNDCTSFRDHCDVEALREARNEDLGTDEESGSGAAPPSVTDDPADTDTANTSESRTCSMQAPGLDSRGQSPWVSLIGIGLASGWLRRRRRVAS